MVGENELGLLSATRAVPFNEERAKVLLFEVAAGRSIEEGLKVAGIRFIDMCYWRLNSPSFDKAFSKVRQITAEVYLDRLAKFADEIDHLDRDKDEIKKAELKIKTLCWLIERMNPDSFAPKTRIEQKTNLSLSDITPKITVSESKLEQTTLVKNV